MLVFRAFDYSISQHLAELKFPVLAGKRHLQEVTIVPRSSKLNSIDVRGLKITEVNSRCYCQRREESKQSDSNKPCLCFSQDSPKPKHAAWLRRPLACFSSL